MKDTQYNLNNLLYSAHTDSLKPNSLTATAFFADNYRLLASRLGLDGMLLALGAAFPGHLYKRLRLFFVAAGFIMIYVSLVVVLSVLSSTQL